MTSICDNCGHNKLLHIDGECCEVGFLYECYCGRRKLSMKLEELKPARDYHPRWVRHWVVAEDKK